MNDQRLFTRVPSSLEVDIILETGDQLSGRLRNLCMRGLYVERDASPRVGLDCNVTVYAAGREHDFVIEAKGHIERCDLGGIGVKFDEFTPEAFDRLRGLVLAASPNPERIEEELERHLGVLDRNSS